VSDDDGYTKKETDWLGQEKEVHYDSDGNKTGETRQSQDWLGQPRQEHFDTDGAKVGETRQGQDWLGNDRAEHFDRDGDRTGFSRDTTDWLGRPVQKHFDAESGDEVGTTQRGTDWLGRPRKEHRGEYFKTPGGGISHPGGSQSSDSVSSETSYSTRVSSPSSKVPALLAIFAVGVIVFLALRRNVRDNSAAEISRDRGAWTDTLAGSSLGLTHGVRFVDGPAGPVAQLRLADHSRIEYPGRLPAEGTFEIWLLVNSGYGYQKGSLTANKDSAVVFSTDNAGADVAWPGAATLFVNRDGRVEFTMTTVKYGTAPNQIVVAAHSSFRFAAWHSIGVSWGSKGQSLIVDGKAVAAEPTHRQRLSFGGTHQVPKDVPTVGETVSCFWPEGQYAQGFEGNVARIRVSGIERDWSISRRRPFESP